MQQAYAILEAAKEALKTNDRFIESLMDRYPVFTPAEAQEGIEFLTHLLVNADALSDSAVEAWIRETARKENMLHR